MGTTTSTMMTGGGPGQDSQDSQDDGDSDGPDGPPVKLDVSEIPPWNPGDCDEIEGDLTLTGQVWGPNGEIPVSGALVYTSPDRPQGIPQHVYCAECTELTCEDPFTTTNPDGTFTLETIAKNARWFVVQKGQFLRYTQIDWGPGNRAVEDTLTTLPSETNADNGEFIPLIAVGDGGYDRLEDGLGKFGLGDTIIENFEERLVPGTEPFELWDNGRDPATDGFPSQGTFAQLVSDYDNLSRYHIIFVPCSYDDYVSALTPAAIDNIRDWVEAGGRWYVSDWSNEWLINVFPEYQDLDCFGAGAGACDQGSYDSLADVMDEDLLEWLEELPEGLKDINPLNDETHPTLYDLPQVLTVDNWSSIINVPEILVPDGMGGEVNVGHKVWLEGPGGGAAGDHPLTVTGQYGCGKLQFTSYHMAEFFNYVGLSPQELVLIYTILEISACQDYHPPPEG